MGDDGDDEDDRDLVVELALLSCNVEAVAVFRLCPAEVVGGMGGWLWTGIAPTQILAAMELLDLPVDPALAADVHFMGAVVAAEHNARQQRMRTAGHRAGRR